MYPDLLRFIIRAGCITRRVKVIGKRHCYAFAATLIKRARTKRATGFRRSFPV